MNYLKFRIIFERFNDRLVTLIHEVINHSFGNEAELRIDISHYHDNPTLDCGLYIQHFPVEDISVEQLFSFFNQVREYSEQVDSRILQVIIGSEIPSNNLLRELNGIWVSSELDTIFAYLRRSRKTSRLYNDWLFVHFEESERQKDSDYELCPPDEKVKSFGQRVNGFPGRLGVPATLTIRLAPGEILTDYIKVAFGDALEAFPKLGGENIILTTLLQMNDKISLVNHYSEKLDEPEKLNLLSLSAMNLSLVDPRDETNIAVLVSSGKIMIESIELG